MNLDFLFIWHIFATFVHAFVNTPKLLQNCGTRIIIYTTYRLESIPGVFFDSIHRKMLYLHKSLIKSEYTMRVLLTALVWLTALCAAQAQTKAQKLQTIKEAYAFAQERMANDGKGDSQRKCVDITLHDERGYAGRNLTDVIHIYYYEDHTSAEDGAMQVNNKPYFILREFSYEGYTLRQEFLFEMNKSDELCDDPLIYAYSRQEREGDVEEKRYYWNNEKLLQCDLSTPGLLVEDEDMMDAATRYYKVFENIFWDISGRFY